MCEYKVDTGSGGNLLPIKAFKLTFPNTTVMDLNK